jgi:A/G-specific adenine glycosylase
MSKNERDFVKLVWDFYATAGRSYLPWRHTTEPYQILVSEVMLQQTQVERVLPKYEAFLTTWPTVKHLSEAPLGEVLRMWQGLGYNRRAKYLHQAAICISRHRNAQWPTTLTGLQQLPGVGPYTAGAILAFAYNQPVVILETNIRTVFLHHFFADKTGVADTEILALIKKTLPTESVRDWYAALMDYGNHLKRTVGNTNKQSLAYKKQSRFSGSDRQIRGAILRYVTQHERATIPKLKEQLSDFTVVRVENQITSLVQEGLLAQQGRSITLP